MLWGRQRVPDANGEVYHTVGGQDTLWFQIPLKSLRSKVAIGKLSKYFSFCLHLVKRPLQCLEQGIIKTKSVL